MAFQPQAKLPTKIEDLYLSQSLAPELTTNNLGLIKGYTLRNPRIGVGIDSEDLVGLVLDIKVIQTILKWLFDSKIAPNGTYGGYTAYYINKFKGKVGFEEDGVVDSRTFNGLKDELVKLHSSRLALAGGQKRKSGQIAL